MRSYDEARFGLAEELHYRGWPRVRQLHLTPQPGSRDLILEVVLADGERLAIAFAVPHDVRLNQTTRLLLARGFWCSIGASRARAAP